MKGIELLKKLRDINKPFFTIADLEKITRLPRNSLYVTLKRWVDAGIIERVAQGIYGPLSGDISPEKIAAHLYFPNYLSFESALAKHGILNLIPYTLTFATTRKTRKFTLRKREIEFRKISPQFFSGYEMKNGINIATPEKAFLDELYFLCRGKTDLDLDELNLKALSPRLLKKYAGRFPPYVRRRLEKILEAKG
jgi:predicted transcriptional regulator of viral defense system